eukprot:5397612-Prorocentrum_lima.AAC.1
MTSSLVGSEMCIRDRESCVRVPFCWFRVSGDEAASEQPRDVVCRGVAVSYTHLTLPTICSV